jgi:UDPglucose 6-dehydrogenase
MRTQIIGLGVVGTAQAFLLKKLGHSVIGYDLQAKDTNSFVTQIKEPITDVDLTFICVPERAVSAVIGELVEKRVEGLYVIKSTVPVGTTEGLMKQHGIHICHNPEFLREKHAFEDVMNPSRIVIGQCCLEHGDVLALLYNPLKRPIYRTDATTGELIKIVSNSLRAVNISLWNELYLLCQRIQADIKTLAEAADPAKVLGEWEGGKWGTKFFGTPYQGKCLPKDATLLMSAFIENGFNPAILEGAQKVNEWFRRRL